MDLRLHVLLAHEIYWSLHADTISHGMTCAGQTHARAHYAAVAASQPRACTPIRMKLAVLTENECPTLQVDFFSPTPSSLRDAIKKYLYIIAA